MGQFVGAIAAWPRPAAALDYPVVCGNVRLYNETNGVGIPPTPAIGGVGLIPDTARIADIALKREGDLLGRHRPRGRARSANRSTSSSSHGQAEGAPPPVDLADELKAGHLIRALIREGKVSAVHDLSDGGLAVGLAEMALAGNLGVELFTYEKKLPAHAIWFGEDQGRYLVAIDPARAEELLERGRLLALPARIVGRVGGDALVLKGEAPLPLAELRTAHESWLPNYMSHEL